MVATIIIFYINNQFNRLAMHITEGCTEKSIGNSGVVCVMVVVKAVTDEFFPLPTGTQMEYFRVHFQ